MNVLLMCDQSVGEEVFDWILNNHPEDIIGIVTTKKNEAFAAASEKKIPAHVFKNEAELLNFIERIPDIDLGMLVWWPYILSEAIFSRAKIGFINTHPSMLPYGRGKHSSFWAIVEQVPFGVTLHFIESAIDSGEIVAQREIPTHWEDTGGTLYMKARDEMSKLIKKVYPLLAKDNYERRKQDLNEGSFHHSKEIETLVAIDLEKTYKARDLLNLLRGKMFPGYSPCSFKDGGAEFEIEINIKRKKE